MDTEETIWLDDASVAIKYANLPFTNPFDNGSVIVLGDAAFVEVLFDTDVGIVVDQLWPL